MHKVKIQYPVIDLVNTGLNIRKLMDAKKISVRDIQDALSLEHPQAIYKWLWGQSLPTIENLLALSLILETPINEILIIGKVK